MRRALLLGVLVALAGCSNPPAEAGSNGSTGATTGGSGSSGTTGSGGTTGSSGGSSTGGTTGVSGSSGATTTGGGSYRGYVLFNDVDLAGYYTNHTVTAGFAPEDAGVNVDPLQDCSDGIAEPNGCCYREMASDGGSFDGGAFNPDGGYSYDAGSGFDAGTAPNAGVLTLAANGTTFGTMSPGTGGLYAPYNGSWSPGQQLSVTAAGADIGAFAGAVTAPTSAAITSPAVGGFSPPAVPTTSALLVTWTGSGTKAAVILGAGMGGGGFSKSVTCYGNNSGQQTISSTSMAHFAGENYGALLVGLGNTQDVSAPNATVTVAADTLTGGFVQFQ